jgi:hypothetical protein
LPLLFEAYKGLLPNRGHYLDESTLLVDFQDLFQQRVTKPIRTLYVENMVHSINIMLMHKLVHVLWHGGGYIEEQKFPIVVALVRQILGIPNNQIEFEFIFSIVGILRAFKRCRLQTNNLDKLIFVHKNWPYDPRVGCLKPFELAIICEAIWLTNELDAWFMDEMECEKYVNGHL